MHTSHSVRLTGGLLGITSAPESEASFVTFITYCMDFSSVTELFQMYYLLHICLHFSSPPHLIRHHTAYHLAITVIKQPHVLI